ncbi:MAG: hypothetical protein ACREKN_00105 [Longimicrobiaceae bacterium]
MPERSRIGHGSVGAVVLAVVLVARAAPLAAQDTIPPLVPAPLDSAPWIVSDTVLTAPAAVPPIPDAATEPTNADTALALRAVSPRTAFLRSLVIPGWGQASVGATGRGVAYFALEAGSLWMVYKSHSRLGEQRRRDERSRQLGLLGPSEVSELTESREQQLEDWAALSIFTFFLAAADALVAAYLADFDENVGVLPDGPGGAGLRLSVPVGAPGP